VTKKGHVFDLTPEQRAAQGERARAMAAARDARRAVDPEYDQAFRAARAQGMATFQARVKSDPAFADAMQDARRRAGARTGQIVSARRRRCLECGLACNPGGMGQHLKHKGHAGYVDLPDA